MTLPDEKGLAATAAAPAHINRTADDSDSWTMTEGQDVAEKSGRVAAQHTETTEETGASGLLDRDIEAQGVQMIPSSYEFPCR